MVIDHTVVERARFETFRPDVQKFRTNAEQEKYAQLGAMAIYSLPAGLRIETCIVGQFNNDGVDDVSNYTFQINFTWGEAFVPNFLRPRTADN